MAGANKMDMTKGNLFPQLCIFAFPILCTSFLQQLFTSADGAVVGQFAGPMALAAVGSNNSLINLFINLFNGLSVGANVVIAKYIGQQREERVGKAVPTIMLSGIMSGFILAFLGFFFSRTLLEWVSTPPEVIELSTIYLKIYFMGMPFIMVFNFGSAVLRSYGDTKRPLYALMVSGIFNIFLNLFFVIVLKMSVAGVALATVISNAISATVVFLMLLHHKGCIRLSFKNFSFDTESFVTMFRIGMPASIQGMLFSLSNFIIQGAINSFGPYAVAGSAASSNYDHFSYFFCSAFMQAGVTFTSQNYGAGNEERCKEVYRKALLLGLLSNFTFDLTCYFFRVPLIALFTHDPLATEFAYRKLLFTLVLHCLCGTYEIPGGCMRGFGRSMVPTLLTLIFCCGVRLFWVIFILPLHHTFEFLLVIYPISWVLAGTAVNIAYHRVRKQVFQQKKLALENTAL